MNIPDYTSAIVAKRCWLWTFTGPLTSLNGEPWVPGLAMKATCTSGTDHDAPQMGCTCGIYAVKEILSFICFPKFVCGETYLWGTVVEHKFGWRAQFAYPKSLVVAHDVIPANLYELRLENLAEYGADIFIDDEGKNVPLWTKHSGYDPDGLACVRIQSLWKQLAEQKRSGKRQPLFIPRRSPHWFRDIT